LFLILTAGPITAQQQPRGKITPPAGPITERTEKALQARSAQAVTLLLETADRARDFEDLFYRARIQSLAADTLWPFEPERARQIFRRAWEAANASDKAEQEADEAEAGLPSDPNAFTEARSEVLHRAFARDPALGEVFLKEIRPDKDNETDTLHKQSSRATPWGELSETGARRLDLATDLLNQGATEKAFQLAAPVVNEGISARLILFILQMQEQDASVADRLYRMLIDRSRNEMRADINSVLLLSSPIISPDMLVILDERGSLQYRAVLRPPMRKRAAQPLSQGAREAFYSFAATVLLRPKATAPNDAGRNTQAVALYYATGRLLPFFEREAAQYATELRARMGALGNEIEATQRSRLSNQMETRNLSSGEHVDPLSYEADQLARATDASTRDAVLLKLATKAARQKLWERARKAAAAIENENERRAVFNFILVSQIADITRTFTEDRETDLEGLKRFIHNADVPPFAKAWGLAQAALVAARLKKDGPAMAELLNEAEHEAALTDQGRGTHQRVAAYVAVAEAAAQLDHARAWELLAEMVKAINATEDYTGDEERLELTTRQGLTGEDSTEESAPLLSLDAGIFRLDRIFATMARLDFDKALMNARALNGEVPQAFALIATARATLEQNRSQESGVRSQKKSD
jgi:hypothetical protein